MSTTEHPVDVDLALEMADEIEVLVQIDLDTLNNEKCMDAWAFRGHIIRIRDLAQMQMTALGRDDDATIDQLRSRLTGVSRAKGRGFASR